MFVLALVVILILGVICVGLLKLLSKSISNQRNDSGQELETTSSEVNPEQERMSVEQKLDYLTKTIKNDREQANRDRYENRMWVFWGFTFATASLAVAYINAASTVVSAIGATMFFTLGCIEWYRAYRRKAG